MSSRIEHPLGVSTGKPPLAKQRNSYTADEAIAAKAEIDELVVERLDRRTAAAMKGHITRKTVGYVSKPKQLLEQMIREARREHEDIFLKMSEPLFNEHKSMVDKVNMMIDRYGIQSVIYCDKIEQNVNNAKSLIDSIISPPPLDIEMPSETVILPLSRITVVEDWLHESSIEPQGTCINLQENPVQPGAQLSGAGEVLKKIAFRQVGVQRSCHGPILRSWSCAPKISSIQISCEFLCGTPVFWIS